MDKIINAKSERARIQMTKHGYRYTRIYKIWLAMKNRCSNSNNYDYPRYGAKGTTVCNEWANNFEAFRDWSFANGYSDELTIDRKDNDGNYEPSNCQWTTNTIQQRNKGIPKNNKTGHIGIHISKGKYCVSIGVNRKTIYIGRFTDLQLAIDARKQAEIKYWGGE